MPWVPRRGDPSKPAQEKVGEGGNGEWKVPAGQLGLWAGCPRLSVVQLVLLPLFLLCSSPNPPHSHPEPERQQKKHTYTPYTPTNQPKADQGRPPHNLRPNGGCRAWETLREVAGGVGRRGRVLGGGGSKGGGGRKSPTAVLREK